MNEFRHMSNIRLVVTFMLNSVLLVIRGTLVCLVVVKLVPDTSALLRWVEFLVCMVLHTWVMLTFKLKLFLNWIDSAEELLRRMERAMRA